MDSEPELPDSVVGNKVITADGTSIGRIVKVSGERAFVDPDPDIADSALGETVRGTRDEGTYSLESDRIDTITDDEVHLEP